MFKKSLLALALSSSVIASAIACTGISLTTVDQQSIHARTIEWGENDLNSKLIVSPRNYQFTSTLPDQQAGVTWQSKYGFVGISVSDDRFIGEGVNEKGLTAGLFYFKGYGSLKTYDPKNIADNITDMDFVRWVLSQFETVEEVKQALTNITLVPVYLDAKGQPSPTGHWRIADRNGNNVVLEITDNGKVNFYDNDVGVLTNSPTFPWQVTNLNNYINLYAGTSKPAQFGGVTAKSFGIGSGALGLPGDITPPSRFVRAAFYVSTVPELKTTESAVSQAFHILNNFDLPVGIEFNPEYREHMPEMPSATQWTSVIDQANRTLYFTTMYDSQIKKLDLDKIDFNQAEEIKRPLDNKQFSVKEISL